MDNEEVAAQHGNVVSDASNAECEGGLNPDCNGFAKEQTARPYYPAGPVGPQLSSSGVCRLFYA
jgi:hypothetical protein